MKWKISLKMISVLLTLLFCKLSGFSQNPVAEFYSGGVGYPAWTDRLPWNNKINMSTTDFSAAPYNCATCTTPLKKFVAARDYWHGKYMAGQGGAVLYYPGGTYDFSDMDVTNVQTINERLMLKSGIVIMGEKPANGTDQWATLQSNGVTPDKSGIGGNVNTSGGNMDLLTKFKMPLKTIDNTNWTILSVTPGAYVGDVPTVPTMWSFIGAVPDGATEKGMENVKDIGICWIDITDGSIFIGPGWNYGATWSTAGGWKGGKSKTAWQSRVPDGTHFMDAMSAAPMNATNTYTNYRGQTGVQSRFLGAPNGILVFGVELNDAATINDGWNETGNVVNNNTFFYAQRFNGRISAYGSDVLIANNSIRKPTKTFTYIQSTKGGCTPISNVVGPRPVMWDPGKNIGIDIGKQVLGACGFYNSSDGTKTYQKFITDVAGNIDPQKYIMNPYFQKNIVMSDNYVYSHGNKGFDISGMYIIAKNNINDRDWLNGGTSCEKLDAVTMYGCPTPPGFTGYFHTLDGFAGLNNASDNMSRFIDYTGINCWFDNNWFNNCGSWPGNDGESILCQRLNNCEVYSVAITNTGQGPDGKEGYCGGYDVHEFGLFANYNKPRGAVGQYKSGGSGYTNYMMDASGIDVLNIDATHVLFQHDATNTPTDALMTCPGNNNPTAPTVTVTRYAKDSTLIEWVDMTDDEIGYRVERRELGKDEWYTLAYRPRQESTGPRATASFADPLLQEFAGKMNSPIWMDYFRSNTKNYEYRVTALACKTWTPTAFPNAGTYSTTQQVKLTAASDASIYYTTDGNTPDMNATKYTGPITISATTNLKAISYVFDTQGSQSDVMDITYTINGALTACADPTSTPTTGNYVNSVNVTLNTTTSGADIYYTIKGDAPSTASTKYTGAFQITNSSTIRVVAIKAGNSNSAVVAFTYTVNSTVDIPNQSNTNLLNVYPNPVFDNVNISLRNDYTGKIQFQLYDYTGKLVKKYETLKQGSDLKQTIPLNDVKNGVYFIRINQGGKTQVRTILKN